MIKKAHIQERSTCKSLLFPNTIKWGKVCSMSGRGSSGGIKRISWKLGALRFRSPTTLNHRLQNHSVHKNNTVDIFCHHIVPRVSVVLQIWESCGRTSAISCNIFWCTLEWLNVQGQDKECSGSKFIHLVDKPSCGQFPWIRSVFTPSIKTAAAGLTYIPPHGLVATKCGFRLIQLRHYMVTWWKYMHGWGFVYSLFWTRLPVLASRLSGWLGLYGVLGWGVCSMNYYW